MATIKVKRGSTTPSTINLSPYEIGYDTTKKGFYINDNGTINRMGGDTWRMIITRNNATTTTVPVSSLTNVKELLIVFEKYSSSGYYYTGYELVIPMYRISGATSLIESENSYEFTTSGKKYSIGFHDDTGVLSHFVMTMKKETTGDLTLSFTNTGIFRTVYLRNNH